MIHGGAAEGCPNNFYQSNMKGANMAGGHISAAVAQTGNNPFLKVVAAISTLAGWFSAGMIVAAVAIT